jgi:hypothetical protein
MQVDKLIEEEMRRSTRRPADYLKELPPVPPARFEGHSMLQQEYERWVRVCEGWRKMQHLKHHVVHAPVYTGPPSLWVIISEEMWPDIALNSSIVWALVACRIKYHLLA